MKNITLLFLLFLVTGTIQAQTAKAKAAPAKQEKQKAAPKQKEQPAVRAKETTDKINSVCVLSGDQSAHLNALLTDYYTKHDALKKQKNILDKKVYAERLKALKKSKEQKFMTILTADQLKKWELSKFNDSKNGKEAE